MSVDLVISAYRDDVKWAADLCRSGVRLLVYDKWDGGGMRPCRVPAVEFLPNVGKCDHTYLHHIVSRYDDLADWTVFSPDAPHDHLRGRSMAGALTPGECLRVPWLHRLRDWGPDGRLRWDLFKIIPHRTGGDWLSHYESGAVARAELSFVAWCKEYVGYDPDGTDWPGYQSGGVFAVPARIIRKHPASFYARLRDQLSHHKEPETGHYMERAWVAIFSGLARGARA